VKTCEMLRPLLSRFAEGEADPEEAMGVAAHLGRCTACKIVLARERRLHEALDGLGDAVSEDEEFSRLVMEALPPAPPANALRTRRRGLRLAGLIVVGSVGGALALRLAGFSSGAGPARLVSELDLESGSRLLGGVERLTGFAAAVLGKIVSGVPVLLRPVGGSGLGAVVAPLLAALALLACGSLLAVTTWVVARRPAGARNVSPFPAEADADRDH
jgi:anti-sigma factor RsiW